jgi:hypothetical protein
MAEYQYISGGEFGLRKPNGRARSITKHRAIWMRVHGEIPKGYIIHHINGNKQDNRIENLECISHREHQLKHKKERECRDGMFLALSQVSANEMKVS